jgi:hypothetical protein
MANKGMSSLECPRAAIRRPSSLACWLLNVVSVDTHPSMYACITYRGIGHGIYIHTFIEKLP